MITKYIPYLEGQQQKLLSYKRFILWGLLKETNDTFRYIYEHYHSALKALGITVLWLDNNDPSSYKLPKRGDVVFCADRGAKNLPFIAGVDYVLHNMDDTLIKNNLSAKNYIKLQVYTSGAEEGTQRWNSSTFFNRRSQTLYQPWGTDLLPDQFLSPVKRRGKFVFWVGSIWDNEERQGNQRTIDAFKKQLSKQGLHFIHLKNVSHKTNVRAMRLSRIAPAIAGEWQAQQNYLPCRFFKNVSYGQLGITNVPKFEEILGKDLFFQLDSKSPSNLERIINMSSRQFKDSVLAQQEYMRREHTYISKIANLMRALGEVS